jgi:flavin-dependent dehydrogenase
MTTFDVVVLGAGPAGATAAAVAARQGLSVCLLDRGLPPAPHLPESWSGRTLPLLRGIGIGSVRDAIESSTSVRFLSADGRFGMNVTIEREPGCDQPMVVRLDRTRFDEILVGNAITQGASFRPLHTVTGIALGDSGRPATVTCSTPQGGAQISGRYVVDATGKSALLAVQLATRVASAPLDPRQAVFCHFTPEPGQPLVVPGTMTIVGIEHGYVFVIPLSRDRVSIGVVVAAEHCAAYEDITQMFWGELDEAACLQDLLAGADQLLPVIPALNAEYRSTTFAGDGFVIAGDAGAFLDPFYCDGIDIAIEMGVRAGQTAAATLAAGDNAAQAAQHADAYMAWVGSLHERAAEGFEYHRLADGQHGSLLAGLADPHLPTVLPLAALLQHAGASPPDLATAPELVAAARDEFADR